MIQSPTTLFGLYYKIENIITGMYEIRSITSEADFLHRNKEKCPYRYVHGND